MSRSSSPTEGDIDIGDEHFIRYFQWAPDRDLNPQYEGIPDVPKAGVIITHRSQDQSREWCAAAVNFDLPEMRQIAPKRVYWELVSLEPLHVEPSIRCDCGDHGFIRDGRWVSA